MGQRGLDNEEKVSDYASHRSDGDAQWEPARYAESRVEREGFVKTITGNGYGVGTHEGCVRSIGARQAPARIPAVRAWPSPRGYASFTGIAYAGMATRKSPGAQPTGAQGTGTRSISFGVGCIDGAPRGTAENGKIMVAVASPSVNGGMTSGPSWPIWASVRHQGTRSAGLITMAPTTRKTVNGKRLASRRAIVAADR